MTHLKTMCIFGVFSGAPLFGVNWGASKPQVDHGSSCLIRFNHGYFMLAHSFANLFPYFPYPKGTTT
jgi:hypothetical protein